MKDYVWIIALIVAFILLAIVLISLGILIIKTNYCMNIYDNTSELSNNTRKTNDIEMNSSRHNEFRPSFVGMLCYFIFIIQTKSLKML